MGDGATRSHTARGLPPLLLLLSGCVTERPSTWVESLTDPQDLHFVIVVPHRGRGPGGWQAACVPFFLERDIGEAFICRLGVEMPVENGTMQASIPLAKRIASDCANLAAQGTLTNATPLTDLGLACEEFRVAYDVALQAAVSGSRVARASDGKAERALKRETGR